MQDLERLAHARQKLGYANATTNKILTVARRAFRLAGVPWPKFDMLSEEGCERKGYFSKEQMAKLLAALPDDGLRDFVEFAWITGMRSGEIKSLTWSMLQDGQLHIPSCNTKNREPHVVPIAGQLGQIIRRREAARAISGKGTTQLCEFVFHRHGRQVADFFKSWKNATREAGCEGKLVHDLRRTASRNMLLAGIPQALCIQITGHRSDGMFRRYAIIGSDDMSKALEKLAASQTG